MAASAASTWRSVSARVPLLSMMTVAWRAFSSWDVCAEIRAETGLTVVSAAYRLLPEHPTPAALEDTLAVARHLAKAERAIEVVAHFVLHEGLDLRVREADGAEVSQGVLD